MHPAHVSLLMPSLTVEMLKQHVRGDIITIYSPGLVQTAVDTVVTQPCNLTDITHNANITQGAAAEAACKQKFNTFPRYRVQGLTFCTFALGSSGYVYLHTQAMDHVPNIASASASTGLLSYGIPAASVHREICVALVKRNHGIFRARVHLYTRRSGHA
jgi:hypothetical protein